MSGRSEKTTVTVAIAGEEYTLRTEATPEYTHRCAAYVDRAIAEIRRQGSLVEHQKAVILAALALADQLFQARAELDSYRRETARLAAGLAAEIENAMGGEDLAPLP